jgi:hypothetical protein
MGLSELACEGTCAAPSPTGFMRERDQFFPAQVTLSAVDPRLAPGQKATGRITVDAKDVLLAPASAVSRGRVKLKLSGDDFEWRDVVTGASDGEMIEIRSGLKEGDEVFTRASK